MVNAAESNVRRYRFDDVIVDHGRFHVEKGGQTKTLTPRAFDLLAYLLEHRDRVVEKQELFERVWKGEFVTDNALTRAIREIRHAIGDEADSPRYIETVHKRGYRFIAPVEGLAPLAPAIKPAEPPGTRLGGIVRIGGLGLAAALVLLAVLIGLNVGGWRERIFGGGSKPIRSLAVLPLENLSGDPEQDYFADGMTEALITELGKISALRVISRQSVMRYKDTDKPVPEIARELNVDAVVEGSVLRDGERVRITTQLIRAMPERHLWAESYERDLSDVLALQGEVARAIAREIKVVVTPAEETRLASARPVNPEAYEAYLKGRYFWNKRTREELMKGLGYFQQAIERDPAFALAYAGLANSYLLLPQYNLAPPREVMPKAKAALMKALALDDTLGEAYTSLAAIKQIYEWDWAGAERAFNRALELDPNYATAHQWYAEYLRTMGRHDEAIREMKRALELDPVSLIINAGLGWCYYYARQFDLAIEPCRKALELEPDFGMARSCLLNAYLQAGAVDELIAERQRFARLRGASQGEVAEIRRIYEAGGLEGLWRLGIERWKERMAKGEYVSKVFWLAADHAQLGEKEEALAWLEKAYRERDSWLMDINVRVEFDPLRDEPRLQDILRRMNFPPQ